MIYVTPGNQLIKVINCNSGLRTINIKVGLFEPQRRSNDSPRRIRQEPMDLWSNCVSRIFLFRKRGKRNHAVSIDGKYWEFQFSNAFVMVWNDETGIVVGNN